MRVPTPDGPEIRIEHRDRLRVGRFRAMAGPCEVLTEATSDAEARDITRIAAEEAWRVERKFSRYRPDNVVHAINNAAGEPVEVDEETARLLDFGATLWRTSNGRFDLTSGVLRGAWKFDGSDRLPGRGRIEAFRSRVGWHRVAWNDRRIRLEPGMEIDFGGLGKEYAVDRAVGLLHASGAPPSLVNFGGDLAVTQARSGVRPWRVGIDEGRGGRGRTIRLVTGGLATSGDAHRYLEKDGVRYPHVLDPRTGRPVVGAPMAVTVAAPTCTEAGMLATLAMLEGNAAEKFLESEGVRFWVERPPRSHSTDNPSTRKPT